MTELIYDAFKEYEITPQYHGILGGVDHKFMFPNGYGASVIKHAGSYGYEEDLFELAVLKKCDNNYGYTICYDTPFTGDVLGHLTNDDVLELLDNIQYYDEATAAKNKELIECYPFLLPRSRWTDEPSKYYDYSYTELDDMPTGWRIAFGKQMCEEIREALIKADCLEEYRIVQIKEKYGSLRWYDSGAPREVYEIIRKYERLSERTCIHCGKPATKISTGWISPFCDECVENNPYKAYKHYVPIEEWFKEEEK